MLAYTHNPGLAFQQTTQKHEIKKRVDKLFRNSKRGRIFIVLAGFEPPTQYKNKNAPGNVDTQRRVQASFVCDGQAALLSLAK